MSYVVDQYVHVNKSTTGNIEPMDSYSFMEGVCNEGENSQLIPTTKSTLAASGILNADMDTLTFDNECLEYTQTFLQNHNYYLRCQIQKQNEPLEIDIYLADKNSNANVDELEQYLKTIVIPGGLATEWAIVELLFNPKKDFDIVLFKLRRKVFDYGRYGRTVKIAYQQLGLLKNGVETSFSSEGKELLKIGVQSHPGLKMCINGEEINVSRSGIYEVKNGVLPIKFFSVASNVIIKNGVPVVPINPVQQNNSDEEFGTKETLPEDAQNTSQNSNSNLDENNSNKVLTEEEVCDATIDLIKKLIYSESKINGVDVDPEFLGAFAKALHLKFITTSDSNNNFDFNPSQDPDRYNNFINVIKELINKNIKTFKNYDEWYEFIKEKLNEVLDEHIKTASEQINELKNDLNNDKDVMKTLELEPWKQKMEEYISRIQEIEEKRKLDNIIDTEFVLYQEIKNLYNHEALKSREFLKEHSKFSIDPFIVDYMYEQNNSTESTDSGYIVAGETTSSASNG